MERDRAVIGLRWKSIPQPDHGIVLPRFAWILKPGTYGSP